MLDKELWQEALNLAKDQLRHGKVHFSELEVVAKSIYDKLCSLQMGHIIDIETVGMSAIEANQKHEKTKKHVKCAICGQEFKTLTEKHTKSHGLTRKEYMEKYGISKKDMSVSVARKTRTGEDNPLKQMQMIMHEFGIKRGDVMKFIQNKGFSGLKELASQAKEKSVGVVELLQKVKA